MLYKNILVAFDESDSATEALKTALELVKEGTGGKVTALYVATKEGAGSTFSIAAMKAGVSAPDIDESEDTVLKKLGKSVKAKVGEVAEGYETPVSVKVVEGKADDSIIDYATKNKCDLIVMGCRGLNAVLGMVGSVSASVIRDADVPVLVIR